MEVSKVFGDASTKKADFIPAYPNQTMMRKQQASKTLSNRGVHLRWKAPCVLSKHSHLNSQARCAKKTHHHFAVVMRFALMNFMDLLANGDGINVYFLPCHNQPDFLKR